MEIDVLEMKIDEIEVEIEEIEVEIDEIEKRGKRWRVWLAGGSGCGFLSEAPRQCTFGNR